MIQDGVQNSDISVAVRWLCSVLHEGALYSYACTRKERETYWFTSLYNLYYNIYKSNIYSNNWNRDRICTSLCKKKKNPVIQQYHKSGYITIRVLYRGWATRGGEYVCQSTNFFERVHFCHFCTPLECIWLFTSTK